MSEEQDFQQEDEEDPPVNRQPLSLDEDAQKEEPVKKTKEAPKPDDVEVTEKKRSCTDVVCCIIFLLFIAAEIAIAVFAFHNGNPSALFSPKDSKGNVCGAKNMKGLPYLFFFDMRECKLGDLKATECMSICVDKCPTEYWSWTISPIEETKLICKNGTSVEKSTIARVKDKDCAAYYLKSFPILGRCIPVELLQMDTSKFNDTFKDEYGRDILDIDGKGVTANDIMNENKVFRALFHKESVPKRIFDDLKYSWYIILSLILLAAILTIIWSFLMRWIAAFMIVFSLFLGSIVLIGLGAFSIYMFIQLLDKTKPTLLDNVPMSEMMKNEWIWLGIAAVCIVLFVIIAIILLCLRKNIKFTISLIKRASKAVGGVFTSLFFPFLPFILEVMIFFFGVLVSLYIFAYSYQLFGADYFKLNNIYNVIDMNMTSTTVGDNCKDADNSNALDLDKMGCKFTKGTGKSWTYILHAGNVFVCIWMLCFVGAFEDMTLAGAFARWCFVGKKKSVFVLVGLGRTLRYHLGTLAFGSLIIAIVRFIRLILMYLQKRLGKKNCCARFVLCMCQCFFFCLEKILKAITRQAYIYTAIMGTNFCSSAKGSFGLIGKHAAQFAVNNLTTWILMINKFTITIIMGVISYFVFNLEIYNWDTKLYSKLSFFYVPMIITIIISFGIISFFFNVFLIAVDTVFLCNLVCKEKGFKMTNQEVDLTDLINQSENDSSSCCCC